MPIRACRADAVARLIGKMAHPLNRPRFDARAGRVVEGYGILQPRVTPSLAERRRGLAVPARVLGRRGLDPYAVAVSDVYQDLLRRGLLYRQGHLRCRRVRGGAARPASRRTRCSATICSRASSRARVLASDVEVVEEFPSRYDVDASRQHRWTRGDWQLLPWIFARGASTRSPSRRRRLEDARQSAPYADAAGDASGAAGRRGVATAPAAVPTFFLLAAAAAAAAAGAGGLGRVPACEPRSHFQPLAEIASGFRKSRFWSCCWPTRRG